MANKLVIVESPTKIKTISKILGKAYKVTSSMGHLIDLPKSTLGVDIEHDFEPKMIVVRAKQKILSQLKKEVVGKKEIYFATDPDREGEAIGWNLAKYLGDGKDIFRVTFQEITKDAVLRAFEKPRKFNENLINAQMARRILDRIVGYKISPLLWKKVGSRLSAGRVQSVALRLVVDREKEIKSFIPKEYWQIAVDLQKQNMADVLTAQFEKADGEKIELKTQAEAAAIVEEMRSQSYVISGMTERQRQRKSLAPYTTSTMQQEAFTKLGFNADRTMRVAQQLYEGLDVGDGDTVGLITYMRTDSVNISQEALGKVRTFIQDEYGKDYLPQEPNKYRSKKSAQEAHEAIRPSDIHLKPADVESFLDRDQFRLYELIWRRFVSSQMTPAVYKNRKIEITAGRFQFGVTGSIIVFDGFLRASQDKADDEAPIDLSQYEKGDALSLVEVKPTQHFTKPPPRYSDASLVKALEEDGIGRPSTYASIIHTLVNRNYVLREKGYFRATDLGIQVCDLLIEYFKNIMDIKFTAGMEENLDKVEDGDLEYVKLLKEFYHSFKDELVFADDNMERTQTFVDEKCTDCGRPMVIKWGRRGKFLSCSGFPKCKFAKPITTGIACPQEGCEGQLVQRSSRGRFFYGCTKYPQCTYTSNNLPDPK